ncbi:MAG: DUF4861 family protein [Bacteroidales bacterium]|nr:DUF4861 family protein [Bacteroidales bacterium]MBN2817521.1 DUF4861 family protein [Bacteroidales bacterium]
MKTKLLSAFFIWSMFVLSCKTPVNNESVSVLVSNSANKEYNELVLELKDKDFIQKVKMFDIEKLVAEVNDTVVPMQLTIKENELSSILVLLSISEKSSAKLSFKESDRELPVFKKRTQAELSVKEEGEWVQVHKDSGVQQYEYQGGKFVNVDYLRVPDKHTDHSFYIRYEGPGWESDKVGYRFYLDWRNAVDIYGKRTPEMVLQNVGQDGFESYHELQNWGMDILKVGGSLGIGSIGYWDGNSALRVAVTDSITCKILNNGIIRSSVKTKYYGWNDTKIPVDLKSIISIDAGSRLTHQEIFISDVLDNLCTGIVKADLTELLQPSESESEWTYLATFGKQSLNNDNLGMVVFFRNSDLIELTEDLHSKVIVLKPRDNKLEYYYGALWEMDDSEIKTIEDFKKYLDTELLKLNNPLTIKY